MREQHVTAMDCCDVLAVVDYIECLEGRQVRYTVSFLMSFIIFGSIAPVSFESCCHETNWRDTASLQGKRPVHRANGAHLTAMVTTHWYAPQDLDTPGGIPP